jgi:ribonuclease HI
VPWWNSECQEAVKLKKIAWNRLKRNFSIERLVEHKRLQAKVTRTIKKAKRDHWRQYCSEITRFTPSSQIWRKAKAIASEKTKSKNPLPTLIANGVKHANDKEKAEVLATVFIATSSSDNHDHDFVVTKTKVDEHINHLFSSGKCEDPNNRDINKTFNRMELEQALGRGKSSSPGEDGLKYDMLRNMPEEGKQMLLNLYNLVWSSGKMPSVWKTGIVVPIPKQGKDKTDPRSYRPISLTSCLCKVMERMIKNRLEHEFEHNGLLHPWQSGFRKGRRTTDHLVRLTEAAKKALDAGRGNTTIGVFLDVEKAFDMMWRNGVLKKLYDFGYRGRILFWIRDFLDNRRISVRVNGQMSREQTLENGTPQGGVISPLLFNIMMSDLPKDIEKDHALGPNAIGGSIFADDTALWNKYAKIDRARKTMQKVLDIVSRWCKKNGFKLSAEKTVQINFTNVKYISNDANLYLNGQKVKTCAEAKFLGLTFDRKLTWNPHIKSLRERCFKQLNLLRSLTKHTWGADLPSMLMLYRGLILSRIDYGCEAYATARKSLLETIDTLQTKCLRICCGASQSSPRDAINVECGEIPLDLRREERLLKFWTYLQSSAPTHPTREVCLPCKEHLRHKVLPKMTKKTKPPGLLMTELVSATELVNVEIESSRPAPDPPWLLPQIKAHDSLSSQISKKDPPALIKSYALENIDNRWKEHRKIYTDASKMPYSGECGAGVVIGDQEEVLKYKLPNHLSIFTAELVAIKKALEWIKTANPGKYVILTDSLSSVKSFKSSSSKSRDNLIKEIRQLYATVVTDNKTVDIDWVPSHVDIKGNEQADEAAKQALKDGTMTSIGLSKSEANALVKRHINSKWQRQWDESTTGRFLFRIVPGVKRKYQNHIPGRQGDIVLRHIRMGRISVNQIRKKLNLSDTDQCEACKETETLDHFFLRCTEYADIRKELINTLRKGNFNLDPVEDIIAMRDRQINHELIKFVLASDKHIT